MGQTRRFKTVKPFSQHLFGESSLRQAASNLSRIALARLKNLVKLAAGKLQKHMIGFVIDARRVRERDFGCDKGRNENQKPLRSNPNVHEHYDFKFLSSTWKTLKALKTN